MVRLLCPCNLLIQMKKKIFNTVERALKKAEIKYTVEDDSILRFSIKGDHASYDVGLACEEKMEMLMVIANCSLCVPKEKIEPMCRWITEKNFLLNLGGFTLDTSDGELSFRISCPLDNGAVNENIVNVAITNALNTFEVSFEEIMKVLYPGEGEKEDWALKMAQETAQQIHEAYTGADRETIKILCS